MDDGIRLQAWVRDVGAKAFGEASISSVPERAHRLAEEFYELMQALKVDPIALDAIKNYVNDRAIGEVKQELAGVGTCLFALADALDLNLTDVVTTETLRIAENIPAIRAKAAKKPNHIFVVRPVAA